MTAPSSAALAASRISPDVCAVSGVATKLTAMLRFITLTLFALLAAPALAQELPRLIPETAQLPAPAPESRLEQREDGTCYERPQRACPKGKTCPLPSARQIACPTRRKGSKLVRRPDGQCWDVLELKCPSYAPCKQPLPLKMPCSARMRLPPHTPGAKLVVRGDGSCWEEFASGCPPEAECFSPEPAQVRCPVRK